MEPQTCHGLRSSFCSQLLANLWCYFGSPAQLLHNKEPSVGALKVSREHKM